MAACPKYEYYLADDTNIKKPIKQLSPRCSNYLISLVLNQLGDETYFHSQIAVGGDCGRGHREDK